MNVGHVAAGFTVESVRIAERPMQNSQMARIDNNDLQLHDSGVFWFGEWMLPQRVTAAVSKINGRGRFFNLQVFYLLADKDDEKDSCVGTVDGKSVVGIAALCLN